MSGSNVPTPVNNVVNALFTNEGKTLEKIALYITGILTATNVIPAGTNYKTWIVGSIALVLHGLHTSTPPVPKA